LELSFQNNLLQKKKKSSDSVHPNVPLGQFAGNTISAHPPSPLGLKKAKAAIPCMKELRKNILHSFQLPFEQSPNPLPPSDK
jgi:hypothetical protein